MDAKSQLKINQKVYFIVQKNGRANCAKKYTVHSGKIKEIRGMNVIVETPNKSVHNRKIGDIYFSPKTAKKMS